MITAPTRVSIVIPSFNQGEYLRECLDSILAQDYPDREIVVVDGGSEDSTLAVLAEYAKHPELRYLSEPDEGPADAVNKGLALATGTIVGIQSADDYYLPGALRQAVEAFIRNPDAGLVYGEVESVDRFGRLKGCSRRPPHDNALCIALCICIPQCSAFFRRDLGLELGGWRAAFHTCDWDFWLRMMFRTRAVKLDAPMSAWRIYQGQRTDQRAKVLESFLRMLDSAPELQRGDPQLARAVLAAKRLILISFGPRRRRWHKFYNLLRATLAYPAVWPWVPNKHRMLPGAGLWQRIGLSGSSASNHTGRA